MLGPTGRPDVAATVRSMMARQRPPGVSSALLGMAARPDRTELLPKISVPTLIISSPADVVIPMSDSEAMQRAIPNSRLAALSGSGHLSSLDKSEAFNEAVREFITAL
jgi:3-oxoadipate enol-lactonase